MNDQSLKILFEVMANQLRTLHLKLENKPDLAADHGLAHGLEDRIGSGQDVSDTDILQAKALIDKYLRLISN